MKTLVTLLVACLFTSIAHAGPMDDAMTAALKGPEKKKLKVYDHHFNVKPVEIKREGSKIIVSGHISHHLRWRRDDQVYYQIVKKGNKVISVKRQMARGGWAGVAAPIVAAAGTYLTGKPIPPDKVEAIGRAIGRAQDGSWEGACDAIIANVALRAK
jgi:hypothetical protein